MPVRTADAEWRGDLKDGTGTVRTETGVVDASYTFRSRFEEGSGTNPEELIGAAHAGCFSMAFAGNLGRAGHPPESVRTTARVHIEKGESGFSITRIELRSRARVPGIDPEVFRQEAEKARKGCPVSRALAAVEITLEAELEE